ncbi:peptidylprolyl isomerase [Actinobacteria bacterium YIM 96077]|uniref:Peptidylprolyl isomerase n=1 Tax=Phytoactinopolyspora halophila TaxID=1981511 RepID=A0A329QN03_9ACTN|nr:SurA N-terminal domain-containing protein [Phytoactinopolyspora halophila]AYY12348.1 peptidylprolyl isomerase [Actinobacteria bacterium YIM 96077]RAW13734.1 peptidylprolyl isomerase [Phytoactinopolyspora halophila]
MFKKTLLSIGLAISLASVAACGEDGEEENDEASSEQEQEEQEDNEQQQQGMPEPPDLEEIPDVVAEVNGSEIPKEDFVSSYERQYQQMAMQSQQSGQELGDEQVEQLKQQTAEGLVDTELLVQEAENRGFEASEEDVNETLGDLAEQNGMESGEDFKNAVKEQQGMEEEELMSQLEIQVKLEQLVSDEAGEIDPTEEELQELYDQSKEQREQMGTAEDMDSFEEMKPQLEEQAKAQEENEAVQALISDLREDAEITINV